MGGIKCPALNQSDPPFSTWEVGAGGFFLTENLTLELPPWNGNVTYFGLLLIWEVLGVIWKRFRHRKKQHPPCPPTRMIFLGAWVGSGGAKAPKWKRAGSSSALPFPFVYLLFLPLSTAVR